VVSGDVLFVAEDGDVSPYEAIGDASAAIDMSAFHDDAVLYLGVADGGVVSDARVRSYECVRLDVAELADGMCAAVWTKGF